MLNWSMASDFGESVRANVEVFLLFVFFFSPQTFTLKEHKCHTKSVHLASYPLPSS